MRIGYLSYMDYFPLMILQLILNPQAFSAPPQNFNSSFLLKQLEIQDVFRNSSQQNPDNEGEDV